MTISDIELADRAAIRDLFIAYCTAFRVKKVDLLDELFAHAAMIDYSRLGGPHAGLAEVKPWLAGFFATVRTFELFVGDSTCVFGADGRTATVTTTWHGVFVPDDGATLQVYGHYVDTVTRADSAGWVIAQRIDHPSVQLSAALSN
jgi:hypothetical protein